ncbi:hypothetical protein TorRG33x02_036890 [Trema orientale]|uniref:Uncharacterized protein n=1 Tax=Trema orientale TaxID=63057 RepID=A0A2P5FS27_TREOI|nr:hypothetical protein TorRG33x02_036890 [Trema orientale]
MGGPGGPAHNRLKGVDRMGRPVKKAGWASPGLLACRAPRRANWLGLKQAETSWPTPASHNRLKGADRMGRPVKKAGRASPGLLACRAPRRANWLGLKRAETSWPAPACQAEIPSLARAWDQVGLSPVPHMNKPS